MQRHEVWLLDRRQGVGELALAPDFEHHHRRKLRHHHEGCRLLRGLLVPPRQWGPRRALIMASATLPRVHQDKL